MTNEQKKEIERAQEDYDDALDALMQADAEFKEAYDWKRNRESWANDCAKVLSDLKYKNNDK